jgi:hypothetical protein
MTIDASEYRIALFTAIFAFVYAGIGIYGASASKHAATQRTFVVAAIEVSLGGLFLLFFRWKKRRVGLVVVGLMMALALGGLGAGLPFLAFAGWLMLRAWRLQRFGTAGYGDTVTASRAEAKARREGKAATASNRDESATRAIPQASKRYTPKQADVRRGRRR